jgi:hypothetical protein
MTELHYNHYNRKTIDEEAEVELVVEIVVVQEAVQAIQDR